MKLDARLTRRSALALAASLLLAGCASGAPAGSAPAGSAPAPEPASPAWTASLDPDAPILNVEGEEGAAMPGECWTTLEGGSIQVQVAGSSIPEPEVASVAFSDGVLTLTMAVPGEDTPATMDYALHQFVVSNPDGAEVSRVVLVRGDESIELPAGVAAGSDAA